MNHQEYVENQRKESRLDFIRFVIRQNVKRVLLQEASVERFASILEETGFTHEPDDKPLPLIIDEIEVDFD